MVDRSLAHLSTTRPPVTLRSLFRPAQALRWPSPHPPPVARPAARRSTLGAHLLPPRPRRRRLARQRCAFNRTEERPARPEQVAQGRSREVTLWRGKRSPLLDTERRASLNGVRDVIAGLDVARVALTKALERARSEKVASVGIVWLAG